MRVVCLHPARDPLSCGEGPVSFGSAPDNDVVSAGAGVDPHHATITADARGLVLKVGAGCQRVYVNARAVRELALLRYGDTVTLGANKFLLTSDVTPAQCDDSAVAAAPAEGPVLLRIVSGTASGRALSVASELRLGVGSRHFPELAYACKVLLGDAGLLFESTSAAPRVNGWRCERAWLSPGDQIALGEHRLVVEAPGLQHAAHVASLPPAPPPAPVAVAPVQGDPQQTGIWWLIAAATVLAAVIAFFLYFRW